MRSLLPALLLLCSASATAGPADPGARVAEALAWLRDAGTPGPDGAPLFPEDLAVAALEVGDDEVVVRLDGSVGAPVDEVVEELRLETLLGALQAAGVDRGVRVLLPDRDAGWRPLGGTPGELAPATPRVRSKPGVAPGRHRREGALAGLRVALSAGHGWIGGEGAWRLQRSRWRWSGCGACRGILEDHFNAQMVSWHLMPLLQKAGADVVVVREPDHGLEGPWLVDDGDDGYAEQGAWGEGNSAGGHQDDYRTLAPEEAGTATFSLALEEPGRHHLSVRWVNGGNRTPGALVTVEHAGGTSSLAFDQRTQAKLWFDLGAFSFSAGEELSVTLSRDEADGYLVADAIKVGGGMSELSGKPWWAMGAESYVPWAGGPPGAVFGGDVTIRPRYAEYQDADLYISFHGNASGRAGGSSASGMSTYRYSCRRYSDHSRSNRALDCDDPPGSRELAEVVHGATIERLRQDWDENYRDRGILVANFGELRELDDAPGMLIESGFFDNLANPSGDPPPRYPDNRSMHDPRWREALAYGVVTGVLRWRDPDAVPPPPRPEGLWATNQPDGTLLVAWRPVEGADSYRLYSARGARAWDDGREVAGTELVLDDLEPRGLHALSVAARNASGEGLASQAVAVRFRGARAPAGPAAEALLLYAYDRRDAWVQEPDNDLAYSVEHGQALVGQQAGDLFFDGALDEVVEDGTLALEGYRLVDFSAGKDSTEHVAVSPGMQDLLTDYLDGGGALIISGEEIGWQLVERSDRPEDEVFLREVLGAVYVADDANTYQVDGVAGTPFEGLEGLAFDDGEGGVYQVRYPDVWAPADDAVALLRYPDGTAAAVAREAALTFGFPLETLVPLATRIAVFERAVGHLLPDLPVGDTDLDGADDACEERWGLDPLDGEDGAADPDGDGLTSAEECALGTDPLAPPGRGDAGLDVGPDAGGDAHHDAGPVDDAAAGDTGPPPDVAVPSEDAHTCPDPSGSGGGVAQRDCGPQAVATPCDCECPEPEDSGCGCTLAGPGATLRLVTAVLAGRRR